MIIYIPLDRGFTIWPFIFIPERVRGTIAEEPYLAHEMVHCRRQAWWTLLWVLLYFTSKRFRMREETLAHAAEITAYLGVTRINDERTFYIAHLLYMDSERTAYIDHFAHVMSSQYWGMCTMAEAREALEVMV